MANTATWIVFNPASGQHYVAPSAYWFIPASGTTITTTIQSFDSSGNLITETTLAAIVRDVSSGVDKDTFPGSGASTTRAAYPSPNGSDVYAAAGYVVGSPASIRMYATYTGTAYDQPPSAPGNLTPASGAIVTSQTPTFTGTFSDPTSGDTLKQYEIVINNGSNGSGSQVWDSGVVNASAGETNAGQFSRVSGVALTFGNSYSWKARVANQNGLWSGYSGWVNFSVIQGPNAPTITAPTGQQSTTTPTWSAGYTSPTALSLASYHWWITAASGGALVFDNGFVSFSSASGTTVSSTFAGGVGLQPGQSYVFNLVWKDTATALSPVSSLGFSIAPLPQAVPVAPLGNATANTNTPTFAWSYTDPNYTQATYQIQVLNKATQALLFDTGAVGSAATSATIAVIANPVAAPVPTAAAGSTALLAGTYTVAYSYTDAGGETQISPTANVTITAGQQISVAAISLPANATGIKYYLSIAAGSATLGVSATSSGGITILTVVGNGVRPPSSNTSNFIAYNTQIQWRIQVTDTAGLNSGWSSYAFATINNAPQAAITAPANASTITNNAPTAQWTYTASTGGQLQASAQVILSDSNGNALSTFPVTGAGTSYTIPAGILQNTLSYQLQVIVTDTASVTGSSAVITFTLLYTPPADMSGQPLVTAKNYLQKPYLNTDGGAGTATGWTGTVTVGPTYTYQKSIDPNIVQPVSLPSGDGPFLGAQEQAVTSIALGSGFIKLSTNQRVTLATAGWVAGTTVLSAAAQLKLDASGGSPNASIHLTFRDSGAATISTASGPNQADTADLFIRYLGPQNTLIPVGTFFVDFEMTFNCPTPSDLGASWWLDAQLEAATSSDAAFIGGDNGPGFSYDANGYSVRSNLAGNLPTINANTGADTDPVNASGGSITITWDPSLADATRFVQYLIDRRRQDQSANDAAWMLLTTITNKTIGSYTDYTAGGNTVYQYSIRQQITYPADGATGVSAHRAIVTGSVNYSPTWYLVNSQGTLYNLRLNVLQPKRQLAWKERAVYSDFLGRIGSARDAGPAAGYAFSLICYFNDTWGDIRSAMRRLFVAMQQLNVVWFLKDPEGLVIPVFFQEPVFDEQDSQSDTLLSVTLNFVQAQDTTDY